MTRANWTSATAWPDRPPPFHPWKLFFKAYPTKSLSLPLYPTIFSLYPSGLSHSLSINTREKFLDHRRELAEHEWARLKANDSLECRNCHNFEFMDFTRQSVRARQMHSTALASGEATCIDCHKGIAHHLPDMTGVKGW